ncbi:sensor histidine kinase [Motilimonas sp. 1_MG-2023]|uniref:sensor histidine kinase n=1 Tax=Motilimonas TaxID=1914248 RepID=UPI0026E41420|nr:HAMP domain-containing sensor histidine kinase [Motilimonas sp. 1_MG-2023]MDO6526144.1 HAMP domain-containing sensor histidine kinase [Motilimonas sp. 1_MG-2023]
MLSEHLSIFTRTSIWRFTLAFTLLVLFISGGILAMVYHFSIAGQQREQNQRLTLAAEGFISLANANSMTTQSFIQSVVERASQTNNMVLALRRNNQVFGNLNHLPQNIPHYPAVLHFPILATNYLGEMELKKVMATRLKTPFGTLLVGLIDDSQDALDQSFSTASLSALGAGMIFTLVVGFIFNSRVLHRVRQINRLTAEVKAGRLQARLPISDESDEFDHIAMQINQMLDEIDELIGSVSSVTDNIAHDLRTPLSRLRIRVEDSLSQQSLTDEDLEWRNLLLQELDHIMDTFNAMLELSRLEKGVSGTEHKTCDLASICQDVQDLIQPIAEDKEQKITLTVHDTCQLTGDPNLLFRAIYNLVDNAVKYGPDGTQVDVTIASNGITIADNGNGIPEEEFDRVFRRLYRLDKSRNSSGFGMGLSIVKAIVSLHQGQIHLSDNQPGLKIDIIFPPEVLLSQTS